MSKYSQGKNSLQKKNSKYIKKHQDIVYSNKHALLKVST